MKETDSDWTTVGVFLIYLFFEYGVIIYSCNKKDRFFKAYDFFLRLAWSSHHYEF